MDPRQREGYFQAHPAVGIAPVAAVYERQRSRNLLYCRRSIKREGITGAHGVVARESRLAMRFEAFACERRLLLIAAPCRACAGSARGLRRFGGFATFY